MASAKLTLLRFTICFLVVVALCPKSLLAQEPPTATPYLGDIIIVVPVTPRPPTVTPTPIIDDTPPVTTLAITGTKGMNDWYKTTTKLVFNVTDDISGISITWHRFAGEIKWHRYEYWYPPVVIDREGIQDLTYYSEDKLYNIENVQTTTLKIDLSPPTATVKLNPSGRYSRCELLRYGVGDAISGLDSVAVAVDGRVVPHYTDVLPTVTPSPSSTLAPHNDSQTLSLLELEPGAHTIALTVTDKAGWVTSLVQPIKVVVDIPSLICTTELWQQVGGIYGPQATQLTNDLVGTLKQAQAALTTAEGASLAEAEAVKPPLSRQTEATIGFMAAYIQQVTAETGQAIRPKAAAMLTGDAQAIIERVRQGESVTGQPEQQGIYLPMIEK